MPRRPHTDRQRAKLWGEAEERGWYSDQVYGRATEINRLVADEGLSALDVGQMSTLIEAVMNEPVWVDPRQTRLPI